MQSYWMLMTDTDTTVELRDAPVPDAGAGQLLVRMRAAHISLSRSGEALRISRVMALPAITVSGAFSPMEMTYSASSASRPSGGQARVMRPIAFASTPSMRRAVKKRSLAAPGPTRSTRFFIAE